MAEQIIRDFYGRIQGKITDDGGKQVARDFYGKNLGSYNPADDKTRDFYGRIVSSGNTLAGLIAQAAAENK